MRTTKAERELIRHLRKMKEEGYSLYHLIKETDQYKQARKAYKELDSEEIVTPRFNRTVLHFHNLNDLKRLISKI